MECLKIERLDHKGRGIGFIDGKIIFIDSCLDNEIVEYDITLSKKKFYEGKLINVVKKSKDRVEPICPFYSECGGCNIMHMNYNKQLEYKEQKVKDIINKYVGEGIKVNKIVSTNSLNYRNKITLKCDNSIGLYKKHSNNLVCIDECKICNLNINKVISVLSKYTFSGKEIIIKSSMNTNEIMVVFDCKIDDKLLDELKFLVSSIYVKEKLIFGKEFLTECLGEYKFLISPLSFFQVNTLQAFNLYSKVLEYCGIDNNEVLDLYCGTGTIGIFLSKYCKSVIGIEINESSILNARMNAELNKCENIKFYLGDVGRVLSNIECNPDVVVVDPPRSGLDDKTKNILLDLESKKIVYVSCDPMTLARDLKTLESKYGIVEITPFDMFPNTYHVECVTLLCRKPL